MSGTTQDELADTLPVRRYAFCPRSPRHRHIWQCCRCMRRQEKWIMMRLRPEWRSCEPRIVPISSGFDGANRHVLHLTNDVPNSVSKFAVKHVPSHTFKYGLIAVIWSSSPALCLVSGPGRLSECIRLQYALSSPHRALRPRVVASRACTRKSSCILRSPTAIIPTSTCAVLQVERSQARRRLQASCYLQRCHERDRLPLKLSHARTASCNVTAAHASVAKQARICAVRRCAAESTGSDRESTGSTCRGARPNVQLFVQACRSERAWIVSRATVFPCSC